jgi:hypothetical protein
MERTFEARLSDETKIRCYFSEALCRYLKRRSAEERRKTEDWESAYLARRALSGF